MRRGFLNPLSPLNSTYCPAIALLDEGIVEKLQQRINKTIISFPDFADDSPPEMDCSLVKQILIKANGRKIIGLVGGQDKRKGFLTLLRVSQKSKRRNTKRKTRYQLCRGRSRSQTGSGIFGCRDKTL